MENSDNSPEIKPNKRASVAERFIKAKEEQNALSAEKVKGLRDQRSSVTPGKMYNDDNSSLTLAQRYEQTVHSAKLDRSAYVKSLTETRSKQVSELVGTGVKDTYSRAINESREAYLQRLVLTRQDTISRYVSADGVSVRRKIGLKEEFFMQSTPTKEDIDRIAQAALLIKNTVTTTNATGDHVFLMGSIQIYECKSLNKMTESICQRMIRESYGQPRSLQCSIYNDQGKRPPITLAAVIYSNGDSPYLALEIKPVTGNEYNTDAFGVRKIGLYSPYETTLQMFDRIFDVVPIEGWQQWSENTDLKEAVTESELQEVQEAVKESIEQNTEDINDAELVDAIPFEELTVSTNEEPTVTIEEPAVTIEEPTVTIEEPAVTIEEPAVTIKEPTVTIEEPTISVVKDPLVSNEKYVPEELNNVDEMPPPPESGAVDDQNEAENDEIKEEAPFNYGLKDTMAQMKVLEPLKPPVDLMKGKADNACPQFWTCADEDDTELQPMLETMVSVKISDITNVSCAGNCFVLQCNDTVTVITGNMKSCTVKANLYVVNDKAFQWIKGAAWSGWRIKWPMKSQGMGRMTKRFFVLRDDEISYFKTVPRDRRGEKAEAFIRLVPQSIVKKDRKLLMSCITVQTPLDTLWLRAFKDSSDDIFINEVKRGIEANNRRPIFWTKSSIDNVWYNESNYFRCVAVDASHSRPGQYSHSSLFSLKIDDGVTKSRTMFSIDAAFSHVNSRKPQHDISLYHSKAPYSVPFDSEQLFSIVKLIDDCIVVGGTNGFISVLSVKKDSTTIAYCLPPKRQLKDTFETPFGHSRDSTILCIGAGHKTRMFVAGDDYGGVSLWKIPDTVGAYYEEDTANIWEGAILCDFILVEKVCGQLSQKNEKIRSITFLPDEDHVLVGTSQRLILFIISGRNTFSYYTELDKVGADCQCVYGVYTDNRAASSVSANFNRMILWKIVQFDNSTTGGSYRGSSKVVRIEWSKEMHRAAVENLKPIDNDKDDNDNTDNRGSCSIS